MDIKVLGPGCTRCKNLEKIVYDAVAELGVNATITKVSDVVEIMKYGVMATPALVVNENVEIKGRVPSKDEVKEVLAKY
ncbi:thioredoxin family protein [uncultured Acetobacteroides sp.]|uniref:thioredoxin family protein n=1 Tax=uncultured Acetobacteroides sp. TaxID=1760811 RepID=UPI0029F4D783|nr:thioredoxin family protein [uncultured Acetobacteroides sp.]